MEDLHWLIDMLPEEKLQTARKLLRDLLELEADPILRAFVEAPEDSEPLTEGEARKLEEAHLAIARGEVAPLDEVAKRLLREPWERTGCQSLPGQKAGP